jgi:hypothetical protein
MIRSWSEKIPGVSLMQSGGTCVHLQIGVAAIKDRFNKTLDTLFRNLQPSINAIISSVIGRIVAPGTHRTDLGYLHLVILSFSRQIGVKVGRVANLGTLLVLGFFLASLSLCVNYFGYLRRLK